MTCLASSHGRLARSKVNCLRAFLLWLFISITLTARAAPPIIEYQPKDQTLILYQPAALGVIARGIVPLSYQWRKDGLPIPGATTDQIVLARAQFSDAGNYSVVISNAESSVTSSNATLTVSVPAGGALDYSFVWGGSIDQPISAMALQPDGRILIAGSFSAAHGGARGGIARLNRDGTTDQTFMNGLSGAIHTDDPFKRSFVYAVALQADGKV